MGQRVVVEDHDISALPKPGSGYIYYGRPDNSNVYHLLADWNHDEACWRRFYLIPDIFLQKHTNPYVERPEQGQLWERKSSGVGFRVVDVTKEWVIYNFTVVSPEDTPHASRYDYWLAHFERVE